MFFLKPKPSVPVQPAMGCSVGHVSFEDAYEAMFCFATGEVAEPKHVKSKWGEKDT